MIAVPELTTDGLDRLLGERPEVMQYFEFDRLPNETLPMTTLTETQGALRTAAAGLRAATTKAQALSAISQCQAVIGAAFRQSKAIGGELVRGWGRSAGLAPIISVLARATRLIQQKG